MDSDIVLFERDISAILRHINNIFKEDEVEKESNLHFLQMGKFSIETAHTARKRCKQ